MLCYAMSLEHRHLISKYRMTQKCQLQPQKHQVLVTDRLEKYPRKFSIGFGIRNNITYFLQSYA